jgi:hypothetical protein
MKTRISSMPPSSRENLGSWEKASLSDELVVLGTVFVTGYRAFGVCFVNFSETAIAANLKLTRPLSPVLEIESDPNLVVVAQGPSNRLGCDG